jgi:hypothetical protein
VRAQVLVPCAATGLVEWLASGRLGDLGITLAQLPLVLVRWWPDHQHHTVTIYVSDTRLGDRARRRPDLVVRRTTSLPVVTSKPRLSGGRIPCTP